MVRAILESPSLPTIDTVNTEIISPAWLATTVAPTIWWLPSRRWISRKSHHLLSQRKRPCLPFT
jgi:hypothetical protein